MNKKTIIKIALFVLLDIVICDISLLLGFVFIEYPFPDPLFFTIYFILEPIALCSLFIAFRVYKTSLKYFSVKESIYLLCALLLFAGLNVTLSFIVGRETVPLRVTAVSSSFIALACGFLRICPRLVQLFKSHGKYNEKKNSSTKVLIVGAGDAGHTMAKEMLESDKANKIPVGFIDDDDTKINTTIDGINIYGTRKDLVRVASELNVDEILIAMPSASAKERAELIEVAKESGKKITVLPGIYEMVNGTVSLSSIREVKIEDLLGREQVKVNLDEIMEYIKDRVVLVTGGGGSIGSELCRQIATHNPKMLIIIDIYENNAYDIEQELKRTVPSLNLVTLIASVRDKSRIDNIFDIYRPQIVFNAAAHKHVPLMEMSPHEAIKNNVFGTFNVAMAAVAFGTKKFVQISTDKAVNPTNVMGASKRMCEMIVQTIGRKTKSCDFVAVRFGNVLGSNGSVIPLFKKQIAEGGPITLTDKNIVRYFMTIPEAVSLVLQAGAYAKGGQIFVLDMGEPVKIYDLAVNLIQLSGLKVGEDIEIKEIGLRPGEKLYEERLMDEEGLKTTANGLISVAKPIKFREEEFLADLEDLNVMLANENEDIRPMIKRIVPTYVLPKDVNNGIPDENAVKG